MELPADLIYSEEHVWIHQEGKRVRLGLTDFIQEELGNIIFAELPREGDELQSGEPFGSLESVKSVTELYSPVSGRVVEVNRALADFPGQINLEPYASWLIVMELADPTEKDKLWSADKYAETYGGNKQEDA
jgi:glycine cleavage system H protein